jgi:hypothetical protein
LGDVSNSPGRRQSASRQGVAGKAHLLAKLDSPRVAQTIWSLPASILRSCEMALS